MVGSETSDISDAGSIPVISSVAVNPDCPTLRQVFRAASRQISDMAISATFLDFGLDQPCHIFAVVFAADAARGRGTDAQPFWLLSERSGALADGPTGGRVALPFGKGKIQWGRLPH